MIITLNIFFINSIGKLTKFRLKQKGYDKNYQERAWNEAKQDPSLHNAVICQKRLKVQKSRLKGIHFQF